MLDLRPAIRKLQSFALLAGVKEAPDLPTETNMVFPFSVCYPSVGTVTILPGPREKAITSLNLDVHTNKVDLPTDIDAMLGILQDIKPMIVQDPTLGETVNTVIMDEDSPMGWTFGAMKYANVDTVGFRMIVRIKQEE